MPTNNSAPIKVQMTGLDGLLETLEGISEDMRSIILQGAVGEAAKPLVAATKGFVPRKTGALQRSIKQKVLRNKNNGTAVALVGPSTEYFSGGVALKKHANRQGADRPCNYAHLVEFGHNTPKGMVAAHPFMRPGVAVAGPQINLAMTLGVSKGLVKAAKKLIKNG